MATSAQWSIDRTQVPLSGAVAVTVQIRGSAPLRVDVPKAVLADESAPLWELTPRGPATLADQPGGEQLWTQEFTASPFAFGEVLLALKPFNVTAGNDVTSRSVSLESKTIRVERTIQKVDASEARPVTDIERLPDDPPTSAVAPGVWLFAGVVAALLIGGAIVALRRKRPTPEVSPRERLESELLEIERAGDAPHRLATALRLWLKQTAAIPADNWTTEELAAVVPDAVLISILRDADGARFASGSTVDPTALIARTREWLTGSDDAGT